MASVPSGQRDAYGEERRNSDISLTSNVQPVLPTYENSTDPNFNKDIRKPSSLSHVRTATLFYIAFYLVIAVSGWVIVCTAAITPIPDASSGIVHLFDPQRLRAARILTSVAGLLTIPLTSATCAYAAASYIQYTRCRRNGLTLRQSLALANRSWADPKALLDLLLVRPRQHGSPLLWVAIVLNVIGILIYPLQQLLVGEETAMAPLAVGSTGITDVSELYGEGALAVPDSGRVSSVLRSVLSSTTSDDPQPHLWQTQVPNCRDVTIDDNYDDHRWCQYYEGTDSLYLEEYRELRNPFVAQLHYGFSTGTIQQIAPRINSSVTYEAVPDDEFTENCSDADDFNFKYHFTEGFRSCDLQACMPGNLSVSPFKNQRDPQHIEEVLYLNVSALTENVVVKPTAYKAVMRTTLGYFELPNYMNAQTCGPLLDKDSTLLAEPQFGDLSEGPNDYPRYDRPYGLASVPGKGPLAEIAVAVFGNGSFLEPRQNPDYTKVFPEPSSRSEYFCTSFAPMAGLAPTSSSDCSYAQSVIQEVSEWVNDFENTDIMTDRLASAAFLANDLHLKHGSTELNPSTLRISYDSGRPFQKPTMTRATMIAISVLLGLYLFSLLVLAFSTSFQPTWTEKLDAFAMMRMGAALSDRGDLFAVTSRFTKGEALDRLPGYVGDLNPEDEVGRLGVGATGRLVRKRKYYASNI